MKTQYTISWILRGLGIVAILVYFFGGPYLGDWFPGLLGKSMNPVFYAGIVLYIIGAVYYRILFRQERKRSREESRK